MGPSIGSTSPWPLYVDDIHPSLNRSYFNESLLLMFWLVWALTELPDWLIFSLRVAPSPFPEVSRLDQLLY